MIYYYSGCGNSRYVAASLSKELGEDLEFIPDLIDKGLEEFDCEGGLLGFVFPVYAWDVPTIVRDFIKNACWKGKPEYVWFACTCGDNIGLTDRQFRKILASVSLELDACFTFQMPETYLCFPGFSLDTDENAKLKNDAVRAKIPVVAEQIKGRQTVSDLIPGKHPWVNTHVIGSLFHLTISDSGFHTTDDCIGCGICARSCPVHNITMENQKHSSGNSHDGQETSQGEKRPKWNGNCLQCMACYHYCPKNAVQYRKLTAGKGQYFFK